jgi:hypothetical protein
LLTALLLTPWPCATTTSRHWPSPAATVLVAEILPYVTRCPATAWHSHAARIATAWHSHAARIATATGTTAHAIHHATHVSAHPGDHATHHATRAAARLAAHLATHARDTHPGFLLLLRPHISR